MNELCRTAKWKQGIGVLGLFLLFTTIALVIGEFAIRLAVSPVDYLQARPFPDEILGMHLPPGSGGHDEWGFRNPKIPKSPDIVALGDSHTYGNCAKMKESWPYVLGALTGNEVYNMGMGGYGPNQYWHLLQNRALSLKPRVIVCGLYMGDDFDNAYRITYGLEHWSRLRQEGLEGADPDIWEERPTMEVGLDRRIRDWLSEHSVVYRGLFHDVLRNLKGRIQIKYATRFHDQASTLVLPEENIEEAFLPRGLLRGLDQDEAGVREGMRLTSLLLEEMNSLCASNQIRFVVAVIPTKETVFARYLENNADLAQGDVIRKLISNERIARQELFAMLEREKIEFVDPLADMAKAIETEKLYTPGVSDMHPARNGYRVIAESIARSLASAE